MTTRYLASIAGVHCAVPLRDQLSSLITHTQYLADRNIYAAVLTRQQWDKLREEFWETGRQCDHGRLVPDIDFIASDGKVFLDFAECQKHEAGIGIVSPTNAGRSILDAFNAVATDQEKQTLAQMALSWTLRHGIVSSTLIGASSVAQLEGNLKAAAAKPFTVEELAAIEPLAIHGLG